MPRTLEFAVEYGDIRSFDADVIALKYAQSFYGADRAVATALTLEQEKMDRLCPGIGDYRYVETYGRIRSQHVLFVGGIYSAFP